MNFEYHFHQKYKLRIVQARSIRVYTVDTVDPLEALVITSSNCLSVSGAQRYNQTLIVLFLCLTLSSLNLEHSALKYFVV